MKAILNIRRRVALAAALAAMTASADNVVWVDNAVGGAKDNTIEVCSGLEYTIEVGIENTDVLRSFQFEFALPQGLTLVNGQVSPTSRVPLNNGLWSATQKTNSDGQEVMYVAFFGNNATTTLAGKSGAVATFTVQADASLDNQTVTIPFTSIELVKEAGRGTQQVGTLPVAVKVKPVSVSLSAALGAPAVGPAAPVELTFALDNLPECSSLQFDVTMPQGLLLQREGNGSVSYALCPRTKGANVVITELDAQTFRFVFTNVATNVAATGETGDIIRLQLLAEDTYRTDAAITVSNVRMSLLEGKKAYMGQDCSIAVPSDIAAFLDLDRQKANLAVYEADLQTIAALQQALDAANDEVATTYPGYADAKEAAAVQRQIDALAAAALAAYQAVQAEGQYSYTLDTQAVTEAINAIVPNAQNRKEEADRLLGEEAARQAANQKAYRSDLQTIESLQQALDVANANVAANYADYADAEAAAAVQSQIDALTAAAQAAYEAVQAEGVYRNKMDTQAVTDATNALVADAKNRKEEADRQAAEAARQAANLAAYEADLQTIAALQQALDAANAEVAADYADYADAEAAAAVQQQIDALTVVAQAAYQAVQAEGQYSNTMNTQLVTNATNALVINAMERKAEADRIAGELAAAEATRQAANQKAYENDLQAIAALQQALDAANANVAENYAGYADADAAAALQQQIDALTTAAAAAYEAVQAEGLYSNTMDTQVVTDATNALVADAKNRKEEADRQAAEAARQAANLAAYEADLQTIAALQQALDVANAEIAAGYADYANAEDAAAVQERIDALTAAAEAAYEAVQAEGLYSNTMDTQVVTDATNALVADAKSRKEEADRQAAEEAARQAANKAAYEADLQAVADLQQALDAANAEIAANYAEYADPAAAQAVQEAIDGIAAGALAAYEAVAAEGNYTYTIDAESVTNAVEALVAEAKAKKEADGIEAVASVRRTAVYNLNGQRLDRPAKGINIIGGKKVLVK